tara:strand:+ start:192 stop:401 length:210 start_codon:yes stop_codon:yes gene_type:complete
MSLLTRVMNAIETMDVGDVVDIYPLRVAVMEDENVIIPVHVMSAEDRQQMILDDPTISHLLLDPLDWQL